MNKTFRNYDREDSVKQQYKNMRINQTLSYAKRMKSENMKRLTESGTQMNVIDAIYLLNTFVDKSDPDTSLPNMFHFFQTAEGIRHDGHPDWLQLVGLIHDMGKMMFLWGKDEDGTTVSTQWGMVGDTYILGCRLRNNKVYPEFDKLCPDMITNINNDLNIENKLSTDIGIYSEHCGLQNCTFTWGHDEYLYDVLKYNMKIGNISNEFPELAYEIIRYHSLYPWHSYNQYCEIESEHDIEIKPYVKLFSSYDLYTKTDNKINIDDLVPYYQNIIKKYFPNSYLIF